MVECPADGCDYEGPNAKQHWGGKQDAAHTGSFRKALGVHEEQQARSSDGTGDSPGPHPDADSGATEPSEADDSDGDMVELPCGHESFDESQAPDTPFTVSCDTCGNSWTVTDDG